MNVINENRNCSDAIVRSIKTGICVMPASKLTARVAWPSQIHDCLANILENVRQHFEMVIIDVGPSSQLIRELSRPNLLVDAAILVHNVRVPDNSVFVRNQNELYSFGIRKLVVAENFAAGRAA
jgi:MinD-like ATPase involved in chromosome partitioning or flagellar assembly